MSNDQDEHAYVKFCVKFTKWLQVMRRVAEPVLLTLTMSHLQAKFASPQQGF
jgi:hypothetical protein